MKTLLATLLFRNKAYMDIFLAPIHHLIVFRAFYVKKRPSFIVAVLTSMAEAFFLTADLKMGKTEWLN